MRPDEPSRGTTPRIAHNLEDWLGYIGRVHPRSIEMGLDRIRRVAERLDVLPPAKLNLVVAGTNGKGSTTVFAEALLRARGLRVGTALSPHLTRFNERIRLDGVNVGDAAICDAMEEVERARGDVLLTYFEFAILATFVIFRRASVDAAVLEVGLGGRLDAVNLVDADVTVITSIGIDHVEYLGNDRESIGAEKAGILRERVPLVYGEANPPESVVSRARALGVRTYTKGVEFAASPTLHGWSMHATGTGGTFFIAGLPLPALSLENVSTATQAVLLTAPFGGTLERATLLKAIELARLPGRFESIEHRGRRFILDVAHNPHGAQFLARQLASTPCTGRTHVLAGFLKDKDAPGIVAALGNVVDDWTFVETLTDRGQSGAACFNRVRAALRVDESVRARAMSLHTALVEVARRTTADDRIVVCGSFDVVERARRELFLNPLDNEAAR